ncbi:hypothetical protein H5410_058535 [Solanum commersonii]|uniref:G domain-containing protein n=1 Tax=Solanum commersonii TaxID=4109 RepID=A0A9J5WRC8_SOLCO|nr:hypothetical protein H5410_058535 [Solanum commersonii]
MGKGEKTSLGRALVKHHNQMIQQSKEKGRVYRNHNKKVLESVTEVTDLEAVIEQTDEAHRLYSDLNPPVNLLVNLLSDGIPMTLHCHSYDNDLGQSILEEDDEVNWSFRVNFWGTTLFYCDVRWESDGSIWHHFNAYDADRDYRRFYVHLRIVSLTFSRKNHHYSIPYKAVWKLARVTQDSLESDLLSLLHSHWLIAAQMDSGSSTGDMGPEERLKQQKKEEALHASSLRVPRRPPWNTRMSVEELDINERQAFLAWRRNLARLEENEKLVLTPFEKNLDIWRQLWRVVERSDLDLLTLNTPLSSPVHHNLSSPGCSPVKVFTVFKNSTTLTISQSLSVLRTQLVMVVDARDPLFYRCPDLEAYALEVDQHKKTMLLVNKADLLPISIRKKWAEYFHQQGILFLFWSAKAASVALSASEVPTSSQEAGDADTKILGREELLARLQSAAEEIVLTRNRSASHADESLAADVQSRSVMVGFVGYPNVGKSSTINALVGEKRAGVTSTPGKTKHFQTLVISPKLTLCDCPGLVFPSFTSSRYEMIACGVLPIDRITEHREAVQVVANRVPRKIMEDVYNISLPKPKPYEPQSRPPTAAELLRAYCASRGYVASSGLPDETRATRQMLKDYVDGKLPHFEMPPGELDDEASEEEDEVVTEDADGPIMSGSDEDEDEDDEDINAHLDHVLSDLSTFDMANGLASNQAARKKKPSTAPHKQHKKTQRKKDRSWRVQNGEGDGMPVVRVFRKAANTGPVNVR